MKKALIALGIITLVVASFALGVLYTVNTQSISSYTNDKGQEVTYTIIGNESLHFEHYYD